MAGQTVTITATFTLKDYSLVKSVQQSFDMTLACDESAYAFTADSAIESTVSYDFFVGGTMDVKVPTYKDYPETCFETPPAHAVVDSSGRQPFYIKVDSEQGFFTINSADETLVGTDLELVVVTTFTNV